MKKLALRLLFYGVPWVMLLARRGNASPRRCYRRRVRRCWEPNRVEGRKTDSLTTAQSKLTYSVADRESRRCPRRSASVVPIIRPSGSGLAVTSFPVRIVLPQPILGCLHHAYGLEALAA